MLFCPKCSNAQKRLVAVPQIEAQEPIIARDGRFIQLTVVCPQCESYIRLTQHATQDERDGSFSIL